MGGTNLDVNSQTPSWPDSSLPTAPQPPAQLAWPQPRVPQLQVVPGEPPLEQPRVSWTKLSHSLHRQSPFAHRCPASPARCAPAALPSVRSTASMGSKPPVPGAAVGTGRAPSPRPRQHRLGGCGHPQALLDHRCSYSLPKPASQSYPGPSPLRAVPTQSTGEGGGFGHGGHRGLGSGPACVGAGVTQDRGSLGTAVTVYPGCKGSQ